MHCMWQKISFQLHILEIHLTAPRETNTNSARRSAETSLKSLEVCQWMWTPELNQQYFKWRFTEIASQDIGILLVKVSCKGTIELLSFLESELSKARPVLTLGSWKMCSHKKLVNTAGKMYEQWVQPYQHRGLQNYGQLYEVQTGCKTWSLLLLLCATFVC